MRRAFNLAVAAEILPRRPKFPTLTVSNARQGFVEPDQLEALCKELPDYLAPVARFAFYTGWRRQEIISLTWDRVDFTEGVIRLEVRSTKSGHGRIFPINVLPPLQAVLRAQENYTKTMEVVTGHSITLVFHRAGQPLKDNYAAWRAGCERAGLPGTLLHDMRRSAIRGLVRAGVSQNVAMALSGHRTPSIFARYDIVDESDLRAGVAKLAARLTTVQQQSAE